LKFRYVSRILDRTEKYPIKSGILNLLNIYWKRDCWINGFYIEDQ
jgi:hypothetical protein